MSTSAKKIIRYSCKVGLCVSINKKYSYNDTAYTWNVHTIVSRRLVLKINIILIAYRNKKSKKMKNKPDKVKRSIIFRLSTATTSFF